MRMCYLQHVAFEGPGHVAVWAAARGLELSGVALHAGDPLPTLESFDWLLVLGGPMSANDTAVHGFLGPETALIRSAVEAGRGVLGICLGAQLLARALGGSVRAAEEREIGWWPVTVAAGGALSLPADLDAFHWHGETFEPPAEARPIASSQGCARQGFMLGGRVVGLQFHLETTPEAAAALVRHCPRDLEPGPWVQSSGEILADRRRFAAANALMSGLLDGLTGQAPAVS